MSDKYEIYEYKGAFGSDKRVLKNGKAVNEFGLLKDIQKLQAENAELKKQSQWVSVDDFGKHLSDNDFCFVYFPCGAIKKCHLNDCRTYSGKGVYWQDVSGDDLPMLNTKFIKIDIPKPPEGE